MQYLRYYSSAVILKKTQSALNHPCQSIINNLGKGVQINTESQIS